MVTKVNISSKSKYLGITKKVKQNWQLIFKNVLLRIDKNE